MQVIHSTEIEEAYRRSAAVAAARLRPNLGCTEVIMIIQTNIQTEDNLGGATRYRLLRDAIRACKAGGAKINGLVIAGMHQAAPELEERSQGNALRHEPYP